MLARYREWPDKLTFDAVAALPPGEAAKERPTLFRSIVGTLEGRRHGFTARDLVLHADLSDLWAAQQKINAWFIDWSEAQSEHSFAEVVHFTFVSGEVGTMTRGEILLHVVNHATYHRGWIAEMFFAVPARNPTTDLPVFLGEAAERRGGARA